MNANDRFEVKALVFYRLTGMLAPGKDDRSLHHEPEDREKAWADFQATHGSLLNTTLDAVEQVT